MGKILKQGRTDLVRISGNLDQHKYRNILSNYAIPFAYNKHQGLRNFIFQQDGCGTHRAKSIKHYLDANNVRTLPWPAQSPDLNPVENVKRTLKKQLRNRPIYPSNVDQLFAVLCDIWSALSDSYFSTLVQSMERRVAAVLENRGCTTKY